MARVLDVIEWTDSTGIEMVHRIPESGAADIRYGSQLIVRESQSAVFFRDGKALDVFGPGRYTLTTQNIPIISQLISNITDGKTPFQTEIYFVNQKIFNDMKWGTKEPIVFRDSELDMVRLRAFGNYSMKVDDPQLFINTLVGTQGLYTTNSLSEYFRGVIVSRLNDLIGSVMKTILDLGAMYDELNAAAKIKFQDDFKKYGLNLRDFYIQSITPPEEVQKMIDERSSMGALGDMNKFMKFKTAKAIEGFSQQPGGGGAGEGAGLGLGVGVGMMMPKMMQDMMQTPSPQATTPQNVTQVAAALMMCPKCQASIPQGSKFCASCGSKTEPEGIACPKCNALLTKGTKFCSECGQKIESEITCPSCNLKLPAGTKFCSNCGTKTA